MSMEIIEINGLITLKAEEGNVLTTLIPSSLRTKVLYLGIYDKVDNYIEIPEVPEVEMPEEPDLEEQQEVLNGLTLTEAYYQLLNENRVLKEENKKQDELIDIALITTERMYCLLEPLINSVNNGDEDNNPLISMYADMVQKGLKQLEQVPEKYRGGVDTLLV